MEDCEIISRENVRPSSPTPQNLRSYKLSLLDQIFPSVLVPVLLYYHNTTQSNDLDTFISQTTHQLTRSLSAILTRFHPFAGRANGDGLSIDCNDEGVPFVVAKFRGQKLSDLLRSPGPNTWQRQLLPCDIMLHARICISSVLLMQVSYFDGDNSVAIGAVFWHRAADAPTFAAFLNSWAATARGLKQPVYPNYILSSIFPQTDDETKIQLDNSLVSIVVRKGKSVARSYVIDADAISSLKSRSGGGTRVEVVSALIWKCFMAASMRNNKYSSSVMTHAVNLRRRAEPPFPADCFGNFQGMAVAASSDVNEEARDLVRKMRESISKIDNDYTERMRGDGGMEGYEENLGRKRSGIPQDADLLHFSSWCNLGFYAADFGWGKPVRVGSYVEGNNDSDSLFANGVFLMDNGDGGGIEATIILDHTYISAFHSTYCSFFSPT